MTKYNYTAEYNGQKVVRKSQCPHTHAIVNSWTHEKGQISIFSILFFESYKTVANRNVAFQGKTIEVERGSACE